MQSTDAYLALRENTVYCRESSGSFQIFSKYFCNIIEGMVGNPIFKNLLAGTNSRWKLSMANTEIIESVFK